MRQSTTLLQLQTLKTCLFFSVLQILGYPLNGWPHDHGPTNVGAMVKILQQITVQTFNLYNAYALQVVCAPCQYILSCHYQYPNDGAQYKIQYIRVDIRLSQKTPVDICVSFQIWKARSRMNAMCAGNVIHHHPVLFIQRGA